MPAQSIQIKQLQNLNVCKLKLLYVYVVDPTTILAIAAFRAPHAMCTSICWLLYSSTHHAAQQSRQQGTTTNCATSLTQSVIGSYLQDEEDLVNRQPLLLCENQYIAFVRFLMIRSRGDLQQGVRSRIGGSDYC